MLVIVDGGARLMQWKSRPPWRLFFAMLLVAAPAAGCGCNGPGPTTPPVIAPKATLLRVACPAGPAATVVGYYGAAWARRNGAEFRLLRYGAETDPVDDADVWIIRPVDLARFVSARRLLPVPEAYTASNGTYQWDKLLPLYGEKLTVWERSKYVLPLLGEAPVCFYRSDLFKAPEHQNAFQKLHGHTLE